MSRDIVSSVVLSIASRTQQGVQVAVMRRAQKMQAEMLQMIDEVTAAAPPPAPGHSIDRRA